MICLRGREYIVIGLQDVEKTFMLNGQCFFKPKRHIDADSAFSVDVVVYSLRGQTGVRSQVALRDIRSSQNMLQNCTCRYIMGGEISFVHIKGIYVAKIYKFD